MRQVWRSVTAERQPTFPQRNEAVMSYGFLDIAATPSVRAAQAAMGSEHLWQNFNGHREFDAFTSDEVDFIAKRDSFYMATVSQTGWPYIQHRGGPAGFLKVLGPNLIGFADFKGNRQLLSTGTVDATDRVALFLMDYPSRTRLKILAHVEMRSIAVDSELAARLAVP